MNLTVTYSVFATGLRSVDGSPVPGFLAGTRAIFGLGSADFDELPPLRRWIQEHGGTVSDETGIPAPVTSLVDDHLYSVTLGVPVQAVVSGIDRWTQPCEECRIPLSRLRVAGSRVTADRAIARPVASTAAASWLVAPRVLEELAADGMMSGLVTTPVSTPGEPRVACWPDRLLVSSEAAATVGSRCAACGRNVDLSGGQPRVWVPRFSLGLLVDRPAEPAGWWWHASFGQHLPIVSGDVVRCLRESGEDVAAVPVLFDPADAFLPEEYRG